MSKNKLNSVETTEMIPHHQNEVSNKDKDDHDDVDPINAYFKQRCSRNSTSSIYNQRESYSDSSLGVLDLDNVSLLDGMDRYSSSSSSSSSCSQKLIDLDKDKLNKKSENHASVKSNGSSCELFTPVSATQESELNARRKRELAKKNLIQLNNRLENCLKNLRMYGNREDPLKTKTDNIRSSFKTNAPSWFERNQSPHTPRYFVDELNSLSDSSEATPIVELADSTIKSKAGDETVSESGSVKNWGISPPGSIKISNASDFTFETQNPDEILNRLEEDEKKFMKDQSAISNNSKISNFSGVTEDRIQQWQSSKAGTHENKYASIGEYFQLRSHSINSLIGAKGCTGHENSNLEREFSMDIETPTRKSLVLNAEDAAGKRNPSWLTPEPTKNNSRKYSEEPNLLKTRPKRWHSSEELERAEDPIDSTAEKQSIESTESTSTLLIRDLLHGMDSGLSGTQINDRLLQCLGKETLTEKSSNKSEVMETPKSTRTGSRYSVKGKVDHFRHQPTGNRFGSPLAGKKSISKSCSQFSDSDFRESEIGLCRARPKLNKNLQSLRNGNGGLPFDSSTPKFENAKSGAGKFKSACGKLLMNDADWGLPRVSSIRKANIVNDSLSGEDCEKTVVLNGTAKACDKSRSIEDTIAAGDLTIVSERIKEIENNGNSSPCEQNILLVVRELANLPKGSVDCSALTPLLRDQFPELLSKFSLRAEQTISREDSYEAGFPGQEFVPTLPGSWAKFTSTRQDFSIAVDVSKIIYVQVKNQTEDWLIVSLESVIIQCPSDAPGREKNLTASKVQDVFRVGDFLSVSMKDKLISRGTTVPCKVHLTPKVPVVLPIKLRFGLRKLIAKESRTQDFSLKVKCVFPRNNVVVTPNNMDFGVIPEECSEEKVVNVAFDGICELPLKVFIDKSDSFMLHPKVTLNGERVKKTAWKEDVFCYTLKERVKSVLQFKVIFRPRATLDGNKIKQVDLKATFSVGLGNLSDNCVLHQLQLEGSVAFTKFLCVSSTPLIFRVTGKGNSVKKSFPLKNIGAIELKFTLSVASENAEEQADGLFTVPNTFIVPRDEERHFDVVFNAETNENYVRRNLLMQMEPNGTCYEVELTGAVMPVIGGRPISRSSSQSGPSHSVYNPGNFLFHIKSTTQTISWPAIQLDVEVKQTFFIMNSSNCNAMARFSFRKETSSFRFLNDNGESIEKLRKLLKPNCSNAMTVIFRPTSVGPHINSIIIETNNVSGRKMIALNGFGGSPKIFIRNLKSDLNGSKIIRLVNSEPENQVFHATLEFINKGNISGFVSIKTIFMVLSLSNLLEIKPAEFVVPPNSKTNVKITQKLKNYDLKQLLSGKDICKLATVTVTTGDEPSRLRLKKLVREGKVKTSESISFLLGNFINEKDEDVQKFSDDERFENVFRKNLETVEIAAIIERPSDECESTILEVAEETVKEFVTILPASDCTIVSMRGSVDKERSPMKKLNLEMSKLSSSSGGSFTSRDKNVVEWLESLERP